ncbi:MAG: KAP family P-loop NTPase fold protein [Alphaproteobacteria bacterium]
MSDPWEHDKLGYQVFGETFANLIKSIDTAKVISIEARFGRGKTFFRTAWSEQLRQTGEVVIEIDVQQSDHTGDPIVTLLGALIEALPKNDPPQAQKAIKIAKSIGKLGARTIVKAALRSGADELIDTATDSAIDKLDDFDSLDTVLKDVGKGISKAAGELITTQMAAEKIRKEEMPAQLSALHSALTEDQEPGRVIVVIDELDRCHPDYAIAVLEALKLIFNQDGFVFCLMMNANYLENLARHRFGATTDDEKYLDKFVDIRLKLAPTKDSFKNAVREIVADLPLKIPFGEHQAFSLNHAAKLAADLAERCDLSMRRTKHVILKVELAMRCYSHMPLDPSLLIFLAFQDINSTAVGTKMLNRHVLTPEMGKKQLARRNENLVRDFQKEYAIDGFIQSEMPEFVNLLNERYKAPNEFGNHPLWVKVMEHLAPHYLPTHQNVLDAVAKISAS